MSLTALNALISLKDGAAAPVNLAPGVTASFTPGNDLVFSLQNTFGIQRAEMTIIAPRYPGLHQETWSWSPGQYNGWRITFPENTLVDDTVEIAGLQIVVTVTDLSSSSVTVSYDLESNLAGLGLGGTITATLDGAAAIGDVLMNASNAADSNRVTKWNGATGFMAVGVALIVIGPLVIYAPIGQTVSGTVLGLGVGTSSWGVVNSSARVVRKKNPEPIDEIAGWITTQGTLAPFQPYRAETSDLIAGMPPYTLDNTGVVDCSDVFRQMALDATIDTFQSRRCIIPKGTYRLDKPIHVKQSGQHWCGESRNETIINGTHAGDVFYSGPDRGNFPNTPNDLNGRQALNIRRNASFQLEHWFPVGEYGCVDGALHGRNAFEVEFILSVKSTSLQAGGQFILTSYGERFANDTAWGYSECFGVFWQGSTSSPTTKAIGFTVTTTAGIQSVFTPTNSLLDDGAYHWVKCNWSSGVMRVAIDGIFQTLTVTAGSPNIGGTLIQRSWETMAFGEVLSSFMSIRQSTTADFNLWSWRLSDQARNTTNFGTGVGNNTPLVPSSFVRFTADPATIAATLTSDRLTDADDFDGMFIKGWTRGVTAGTGLGQTYFVHRMDGVDASVPDVVFRDMNITALTGNCINGCSTFNAKYQDLTLTGKSGIRLDNNCFKSHCRNIYITSSYNATIGRVARFGLSMTNAANVMFLENFNCLGFPFNLVVVGGGDVALGGSFYTSSGSCHIMLVRTLNFTGVCDFEVTDEGAGADANLFADCFVGIASCNQVTFSGLQIGQAHSTGPLIKWQGDAPLVNGETGLPYPSKHIFENCWLLGNTGIPGVIQVTSTGAPLGNITLNRSQLKNAITVLTSGSPTGTRVLVEPERFDESASTAMTDANFTIPRDVWLRNFRITITGTLTADRTVTVPSAEIGQRCIENATVGGFTLNVIASGSAAPAIPATAAAPIITVLSNGTNLLKC